MKDGGSAFPVTIYDFQPTTGQQVVRDQYGGMTLRDYFAAAVLQSFATRGIYGPKEAAEEAYKYADAMLEKRLEGV